MYARVMADAAERITDPQRIRALSHPLRLELIDVLGEGPATATQCADLTGQSVASCSFHLRMLAKYGYIEPADRRGRERPWQLTSPGQEIRPDDDDPASLRASSRQWQRCTSTTPLSTSTAGSAMWPLSPPRGTRPRRCPARPCGRRSRSSPRLSATLQGLADRFKGRSGNPQALTGRGAPDPVVHGRGRRCRQGEPQSEGSSMSVMRMPVFRRLAVGWVFSNLGELGVAPVGGAR